jgi:hypothetical protein
MGRISYDKAAASAFRREAHPLQLLTEAEYQAGLARLQAAARIQTGPVVDPLDLLVLRKPVLPGRKRDGGLHTGGHYPELGGTA